MAAAQRLVPRHIQNFSEAASIEPHWGYAGRAWPCTNDAGSCAYLDVVYHSHDLGMLYCGIIWATVGGILFLWTIARRANRGSDVPLALATDDDLASLTQTAPSFQNRLKRCTSAAAAASRRYLLSETFARRIFGRTTRFQLLILAVLAGYLLLWSFLGIVYKTWVTPVKKLPGVYNTRTSLGPWADRVGTLAFALTPFSILLSSRESILSLLTGVPYHHFNFLHRWLGHIIFAQSSLHTIGWCIVEIRLYQPQPTTAVAWITQRYMVWGIVAMILLLLLWGLSLPVSIRFTGYEFFRKAHYLLAMLYIGACIGHWKQLQVFLIPALAIWFVDRALRLVRTAMLLYNYLSDGTMGFSPAQASIVRFEDGENGDVLRLDFAHPQQPWKVGQHFYLCFPEGSLWQSHPFTPMSYPRISDGETTHTYLLRVRKGETKKLADIAARKAQSNDGRDDVTTPVILTGPYGESIIEDLEPRSNVLCVAGGTGITFVIPILLHLVRNGLLDGQRSVQLIWAVRRDADVEWCKRELDELRSSRHVSVTVFVTRQCSQDSKTASPCARIEKDDSSLTDGEDEKRSCSSLTPRPLSLSYTPGTTPQDRHPDLTALVDSFVESTVAGPTTLFASGPGGMVTDLRTAVARQNRPGKVLKGEERYAVRFVSDNRLEA